MLSEFTISGINFAWYITIWLSKQSIGTNELKKKGMLANHFRKNEL